MKSFEVFASISNRLKSMAVFVRPLMNHITHIGETSLSSSNIAVTTFCVLPTYPTIIMAGNILPSIAGTILPFFNIAGIILFFPSIIGTIVSPILMEPYCPSPYWWDHIVLPHIDGTILFSPILMGPYWPFPYCPFPHWWDHIAPTTCWWNKKNFRCWILDN